jgi:hypothetical protein
MPMTPFPDDLPRRTERALNLLASSGIRDFVADIWDGELDPSIVHLIAPEWGLPQILETELAGSLLYREVLGGGTLHDLCVGVIRDWAKAWGDVEGTYTLDPYEGLSFTADPDEEAEEDPNPIHLHQFTSKISRDPAVWVEWATSDWAHHGFTDMTSWMVDSWVDEGGALSAILQSGVEPGYLNDQMPAYEMDEEATSAALEHTWAQEDAGNEVTFEECEVSPHALLIRMIDDRSGRKTLEWLDGWRKTVPDLFPHLEGDLIRHAAVCAAVRSKTPSPSLS